MSSSVPGRRPGTDRHRCCCLTAELGTVPGHDGIDRHRDLIAAAGEASDHDGARRVMEPLGVTETGADAVLAMQVRRFSAQERKRIRLERSQIEEQRRKLES